MRFLGRLIINLLGLAAFAGLIYYSYTKNFWGMF